MKAAAAGFAAAPLLAWYRRHRRAMPWRGHPDPYAVWVSEVMLQQTQVATVRPYFDRFLARFPDVRTLARAAPESVLKGWEGLGYYRRARNLQRAARQVLNEQAGRLPTSAAALARLPGIGAYTAAAIASICFGEHTPVVDGNVARVFSRYLGWRDDFRRPQARRRLAAWLQPHLDRTRVPGDLNQAMMELGALCCRPRRPACDACPLRDHCVARREGCQESLPVRAPRAPLPLRHEVAVVLLRGDSLLLVRRASTGLLGGLWEWPGGVIDPTLPLAAEAARVLRARTGLRIADCTPLGEIRQAFTHFHLRLYVVRARLPGGRPQALAGEALRWVAAQRLESLPLGAAARRALKLLSLKLVDFPATAPLR